MLKAFVSATKALGLPRMAPTRHVAWRHLDIRTTECGERHRCNAVVLLRRVPLHATCGALEYRRADLPEWRREWQGRSVNPRTSGSLECGRCNGRAATLANGRMQSLPRIRISQMYSPDTKSA